MSAPSCGRAWPRLPDLHDCSKKDCCTNGSRSWKAKNQGNAAPRADHAGHPKTNSFAKGGSKFEHPNTHNRCPLLGVKRTSRGRASMSAFDPKRTLGGRPFSIHNVIFFDTRCSLWHGRSHEATGIHRRCRKLGRCVALSRARSATHTSHRRGG